MSTIPHGGGDGGGGGGGGTASPVMTRWPVSVRPSMTSPSPTVVQVNKSRWLTTAGEKAGWFVLTAGWCGACSGWIPKLPPC